MTKIKTLTLQEVFDNAVRGVYAQGEKSWDDDTDRCVYRGVSPATGKTLKCGIGFSIPDDLYDEKMEGGGIGELCEPGETLADLFPVDQIRALTDIQLCHDDPVMRDRYALHGRDTFIEGFLGRAWAVCVKRELSWPDDVPMPD